jgi:hypothetical protein
MTSNWCELTLHSKSNKMEFGFCSIKNNETRVHAWIIVYKSKN